MSLLSFLYLSRSTASPGSAAGHVDDIVAAARANNPGLGLTGALLFTGDRFAQVLEGTASSIDVMMARVRADTRHDEIIVVACEPIAARRFAAWSMAYSGPSQFVARHVTRLLSEPGTRLQSRSAEWLNDLLWEFAEGPGSV